MEEINNTIKALQDLQYWVEESCFTDETINVILSKIQCEINKQKRKLKEKNIEQKILTKK